MTGLPRIEPSRMTLRARRREELPVASPIGDEDLRWMMMLPHPMTWIISEDQSKVIEETMLASLQSTMAASLKPTIIASLQPTVADPTTEEASHTSMARVTDTSGTTVRMTAMDTLTSSTRAMVKTTMAMVDPSSTRWVGKTAEARHVQATSQLPPDPRILTS